MPVTTGPNFIAHRRNYFRTWELDDPAKERAIYGRDGAARITRGFLRCSAAVRTFATWWCRP